MAIQFFLRLVATCLVASYIVTKTVVISKMTSLSMYKTIVHNNDGTSTFIRAMSVDLT